MRIALGTGVAIEAHAPSPGAAREALEAAFAAISSIERLMHPQRPGSDLRRIRDARAGERTPIHASTWRVLTFSQALCALTQGVFDPCLPAQPGRITDLELGPEPRESSSWAVTHVPLAIDCGGIAKGYAVDCAVDALRAAGCTAGLVNAGGDLRLFGEQRQAVLLRRADGACSAVQLREAALAVSDLDAPHPPSEHRGYYRRDGRPLPARRYAAVRAKDAMSADALTKCLLLCPQDLARRVLRELRGRCVG